MSPKQKKGPGPKAKEKAANAGPSRGPDAPAVGKAPAPASKKRAAPAQADDEEAFPRGGADALTPLERKQVEEEARQALDAAAGAGGQAQPASKKHKKAGHGGNKKADDQDEDEGGHFLGLDQDAAKGAATGGNKGKASQQTIPRLSAKSVSVGMRLLAMVLEVDARGLTLSLPHGLRGHVEPSEASDVLWAMHHADSSKRGAALLGALSGGAPPSLPELFTVGQYVRCEVLATPASTAAAQQQGKAKGKAGDAEPAARKAKGQIQCSLRLKKLCAARGPESVRAGAQLPAVVRGVEDHGYTLELGVKGVKAFLPREDFIASFGEAAALAPGALLDVVPQHDPDARGVARCTCSPTAVAAAALAQDGTIAAPSKGAVAAAAGSGAWLGLQSLLPGTLVNAKVVAVSAKGGLVVSLLGVLRGTVDALHLGPGLTSAKAFKQDQKVKARVLYVDQESKEVALSLLPHVINLAVPSPLPMLGQLFEAAPVVRVDEGLGLLVSLPLGGELGGSCPGYCHIANVADEHVDRLGGRFKAGEGAQGQGSKLKCRVIGFRLMDGLAAVSATTAALEQQILSLKEVAPGQVLSGKVVSTTSEAGLLVQVAPGIQALVPVLHMSDLGKETARAKFKVDQVVQGRVLNVDAGARKLSLTLKPALLNSKLPLITSPSALPPPHAYAHGVVTGVTDFGVYVTFYGGVAGLAHASELKDAGAKPSEAHHVGQVVRARVLSHEPLTGRLKLSLRPPNAAAQDVAAQQKQARLDPLQGLQPGELVHGRVVRLEEPPAGGKPHGPALVLEVWAGEEAPAEGAEGPGAAAPARLELPGHLADHPAAMAALQPLVAKPGTWLGPLVVLERLEGQRTLRVSRKASLVAAARAKRWPTTFEQVQEGALVAGYVANVTSDAVFVRLGAHVTGRAGLSQLADTFVSDPHLLFSEGQSVRAQVVTVDAAKQRFSVTLRPSLTASTDASYLASLYSDLEFASQLKQQQPQPHEGGGDEAAAAGAGKSGPWSQLLPGAVVTATVHGHEAYGLTMDLEGFPDLVGLVPLGHLPEPTGPNTPNPGKKAAAARAAAAPPAVGTALTCRVLDVAKHEGFLYLSAKQELVAPALAAAPQPTPSTTGGKKGGKKGAGKAQPERAAVVAAPPPALAAELQPGLQVEAVVQQVQAGADPRHAVSVLSLAGVAGAPLAHAAGTDFNAAVPQAVKLALQAGQTVQATVQVLPSASTGHRLLVALNLTAPSSSSQQRGAAKGAPATPGGDQPSAASSGAPAASGRLHPGALVDATVASLSGASHAELAVGRKKAPARLCATEVVDLPPAGQLLQAQAALDLLAVAGTAAAAATSDPLAQALIPASGPSGKPSPAKKPKKGQAAGDAAAPVQAPSPELAAWLQGDKSPLGALAAGQQLRAVVLPRAKPGHGHHHHHHGGGAELSVRPSVMALAQAAADAAAAEGVAATAAATAVPAPLQFHQLSVGQLVAGVVAEVAQDHCWVALSPAVRGRLHALDASPFPALLAAFPQRFAAGRAVAAHVARVDAAAHTLDLTLLPGLATALAATPSSAATAKTNKGKPAAKAAAAAPRFVSSAVIAQTVGPSNSSGGVAGGGKGQALAELLPEGTLVMGRLQAPGEAVGASGLLKVHLGGRVHGQVALTDVSDAWVANVVAGLPKGGGYVRAAVLGVEPAPAGSNGLPRVRLSLRASRNAAVAGWSAAKAGAPPSAGACPERLPTPGAELPPGAPLRGYVKRSEGRAGVFVALDRATDARIKLCNLSDGFVEDPVTAFPVGMLVEGRLLSASSSAATAEGAGAAPRLEMTLKSAKAKAPDARASLADLRVGQVVRGRVRRVETFGVFVEINDSTAVGLAHISELVDKGMVKDVSSLFRPQQAVTAKVVKLDVEAGKVSLTLKPSAVAEGVEAQRGDEAAVGGKRRRPADLDEEAAEDEEEEEEELPHGAQEDEDEEEEEPEEGVQLFKKRKGAAAAAKPVDAAPIDDMDTDEEEGEGEEDEGDEEEDEEGEGDSDEGEDEDEGMAGGASDDNDAAEDDEESGDDDDEEDEESDEGEEDAAPAGAAAQAGAALRQQLAAAGNAAGNGAATAAANAAWGGLLVLDDLQGPGAAGPAGGGEDDDEEGGKGKGSKAARKREAAEAERKIREAELARLTGQSAPQTVAEFEACVLASPNSSYTWIRYMAWLLGLGEADKARAVAQRALDTIHYREEGEKFNVWVAWLNLEAAKGAPSPGEAVSALFQRALQYTEPKKLYLALLGILQRTGVDSELEASTLKALCKRFGGSAKVWLRAMEQALAKGEPEGVRPALQRALQALPQRKHVKVITGAALLEFRSGSAERGRSVLEGVLRNYPKRVDLWSVYIDQEVKQGDEQRTRALFERATSLPLAARKVKFLFKRWLQWEKAQGGAARVEHVKERALAFVQQQAEAKGV